MASHLPLSESTGSEIVVRTTYQIILADYHANPEQYDHAATRLYDLALQWRVSGLHLIADCLMDAAAAIASGNTIASWKSLHLAVDTQRIFQLSRLSQGRRR